MTNPAPWPAWLTTQQKIRLVGLALSFNWCPTQEATEVNHSVWGRWAPLGTGPEINMALREIGTSLVGVYRRGEGFWPNRTPALVTPETSFTGSFDEVLNKAVDWRAQRTATR